MSSKMNTEQQVLVVRRDNKRSLLLSTVIVMALVTQVFVVYYPRQSLYRIVNGEALSASSGKAPFGTHDPNHPYHDHEDGKHDEKEHWHERDPNWREHERQQQAAARGEYEWHDNDWWREHEKQHWHEHDPNWREHERQQQDRKQTVMALPHDPNHPNHDHEDGKHDEKEHWHERDPNWREHQGEVSAEEYEWHDHEWWRINHPVHEHDPNHPYHDHEDGKHDESEHGSVSAEEYEWHDHEWWRIHHPVHEHDPNHPYHDHEDGKHDESEHGPIEKQDAEWHDREWWRIHHPVHDPNHPYHDREPVDTLSAEHPHKKHSGKWWREHEKEHWHERDPNWREHKAFFAAMEATPATCPAQPTTLGNVTWSPYDDPEYVSLAQQRLSGAIQIPTQSYDDMAGPEDARFAIFKQFHKYLKKTFPLVHASLDVEKVATYGLLYTWEAVNSTEKPVVLMAHQDVVLVNNVTADDWTHGPFSGDIDAEGWIWGRGASDCKNQLIAILSSVEQLLADGFEPPRDIVLSFGFDEEISGKRSAQFLSEKIVEKYGPAGVEFIVDEGFSGIGPIAGFGNATQFGLIGTTEKGAVNLAISVKMPGGHASMPPEHTSIELLALALTRLQQRSEVPHLNESSPLVELLACASDFVNTSDPTINPAISKLIADPKDWPLLVQALAKNDTMFRALTTTTQAMDIISGGSKINALPESATAKINYRIEFTSSVNETVSKIARLLFPVAMQAKINFTLNGESYLPYPSPIPLPPANFTTNVIDLSVIEGSEIEPAPISPSADPAFSFVGGTLKSVFGEDIVVAPFGMVANTDTKWYWNATSNIYRFTPTALVNAKNIHTVDERMHTKGHLDSIMFFYQLISNLELF